MSQQNDNHGSNHERAYIWAHDCIAICTVIGMAFNAEEIQQICTESGLGTRKPDDPDYQFYLLHRVSHNAGCNVSVSISEQLNSRFYREINRVRKLECTTEEEVAEELGLVGRTPPISIIWALLTDPRDVFYHQGVYLIHRASLKAFRDYGRKNTELLRNQRLAKSSAQTAGQALHKLTLKQEEADALRAQLMEAERERDALKEELARQQS